LDKREEDLDVATTVACFCCTSGRKEVCSVCFLESGFFLCLFVVRKVGQWKILSGQRKTLSGQKKNWFGFQESVFLLFETENTFWKMWKFRNVILFADYIKFSPQTFDCYIYILFWIFVF